MKKIPVRWNHEGIDFVVKHQFLIFVIVVILYALLG
jgi:hypothetical protein